MLTISLGLEIAPGMRRDREDPGQSVASASGLWEPMHWARYKETCFARYCTTYPELLQQAENASSGLSLGHSGGPSAETGWCCRWL